VGGDREGPEAEDQLSHPLAPYDLTSEDNQYKPHEGEKRKTYDLGLSQRWL
jgi:hypothetical protein